MIKRKTTLLIILILATLTFSQDFFLDIPKRIGFVIEYGRIVRQLKIEKRTQLHDYDGTWSVYQRIAQPSDLINIPFEIPTMIKLSNSITLSDNKDYGDIYIQSINSDQSVLSEMLYEAKEITFCTFPWILENGRLEVQKSEYSRFLPVYITNMGYQNKLDDLFADLKEDRETFSLLLDENLAKDDTQKYREPIDIKIIPPEMIKTEKDVLVYLNEEILLYEYDYGIWNTLDYNYEDSSILMKIQIPGKYRIIFTAPGHITYYNLEIVE
jgi:hypothetical protein